MTMTIRDLAARDSLFGPGFGRPIIGAAVAEIQRGDTPRRFLGTVVSVGETPETLWVRELDHDPETATVWLVDYLDFATTDEMIEVARRWLRIRTTEALDAARVTA
jgi:hypothetical protein